MKKRDFKPFLILFCKISQKKPYKIFDYLFSRGEKPNGSGDCEKLTVSKYGLENNILELTKERMMIVGI